MADLFLEFPEEFYFVVLVVFGEANAPYVSAWSKESLARKILESEMPFEEALLAYKWSYSDSPFYAYGDKHFNEVEDVLRRRKGIDELSDDEWRREFELRIGSLEEAMRRLDRRGVFGRGSERLGLMINVEVMPPDSSNTVRAIRLNPPEAIKEWLKEAAEEDV